MCLVRPFVCVSEQMFLIKHIVSRVRPSIMNSSSVSEKAAVGGTMGNLSSVLQREDTTLVMGSATESVGVKTNRKERLDETMEVISPTKSWLMKYESMYVYSAKGPQGNETNKSKRAL